MSYTLEIQPGGTFDDEFRTFIAANPMGGARLLSALADFKEDTSCGSWVRGTNSHEIHAIPSRTAIVSDKSPGIAVLVDRPARKVRPLCMVLPKNFSTWTDLEKWAEQQLKI